MISADAMLIAGAILVSTIGIAWLWISQDRKRE